MNQLRWMGSQRASRSGRPSPLRSASPKPPFQPLAEAAYHHAMQIVTGTVVGGKIVLEGASLPEGTAVTVLAKDSEAAVRLSPSLQAEFEEALDEADREEGIAGEELLERLKKYG